MFVVKCLPFVGTAVHAYECAEATWQGEGRRALWKLGETGVGAGLDMLTIVSGGILVSIPAKVTGRAAAG